MAGESSDREPDAVPAPPRDQQAELEQLRAEVLRLRAEVTEVRRSGPAADAGQDAGRGPGLRLRLRPAC